MRCVYCMPAEGVEFRPHETILRFEEIERLVRVAAQLGIRQVRLTGGEPMVRKGIVALVEMLAAVPGVEELSMTTNGTLLPDYAKALRTAGLHRLNISLDSVSRDNYRQITRRDMLPQALEGIAAARRAGFEQIKLNALAIRGLTETDIVPLAQFAAKEGLSLRFIEFMPADADGRWCPNQVLKAEEILDILRQAIGPLVPEVCVDNTCKDNASPATSYRFLESGIRVGVIRSVSAPFCDNCNRLRLTADGRLRNCLFSDQIWDVRAIVRSNRGDEQLKQVLRLAVSRKAKIRGRGDGRLTTCDRPMHQIGG